MPNLSLDTPNSVLHKLLFGDRINKVTSFIANVSNPISPRALSQTMDVIHEVIMNRLTRQDATKNRNGKKSEPQLKR